MIRPTLLALLGFLCLSGVSMAQAPSASTLTFPPLSGRVVDEAGVLSPADNASLAASLADLEAKTTDQLVVVTLKSLQGTAIEDYGYQLGRRWQIGQKGTNSGALLIVVPSAREVRIEVGYGLEGTLTDAATKIIIETTILPAFRTGDLAGGIKGGVAQISLLLRGDAAASGQSGARQNGMAQAPAGIPMWLIITIALGVVALLILCAVTGGGACNIILQIVLSLAFSGRGGSGGGGSQSFTGGGGSFGGGGSSGKW
jgi:uncharacterized protein